TRQFFLHAFKHFFCRGVCLCHLHPLQNRLLLRGLVSHFAEISQNKLYFENYSQFLEISIASPAYQDKAAALRSRGILFHCFSSMPLNIPQQRKNISAAFLVSGCFFVNIGHPAVISKRDHSMITHFRNLPSFKQVITDFADENRWAVD